MCGILGSINIIDTEKYLEYIKHRGPDGSGMVSFKINSHKIDLLHRRLAIVDLSESGNQPMLSHDNKACISFNGEIYNHLELKENLDSKKFNGHSDTETIVNYFKEFDITKTLVSLNGIFSLAYLDIQNSLLYLARDRFGVKPLYYYFENNKLFFSSEIRPLRAYLNPTINIGSIMSSLRMRYSPSPSTIYQNISKVEPGQLLIFHIAENISLKKTYFIDAPKSLGTRKGEYKKLVNEYGGLLEKAVERQLMSDVEVGMLLSGGIDSALIAAISKQKSKNPIKTFTVGFEGRHDIDEIEYAKDTAAILGLEHFYKKISLNDYLNSIKQIVRIVEEPIGTTSIIPMFYLSELAASKVKVVLSGQGADEPLGGYTKYKGLLLLQKSRPFKLLMPLSKSFQFVYNRNEKLRRLVSSMQCADNIDSFIAFNAISSIKEVISLTPTSNHKFYTESLKTQQNIFKEIWKKRTPKGKIRDLFLYYDLRTSLSDDLLMYTDKITMHFGLECRVPILDNSLIDFIESLKSRYKFNIRNGKIIHRDFAKEYLPTSILERRKLGFQSPTKAWFAEYKKDIEKLFDENIHISNYFNLKAVKKKLTSHSEIKNLEKQIFQLLAMYYLLEDVNSN